MNLSDRCSGIILTSEQYETCQHHPCSKSLLSCIVITQHNHCNLTVNYCIYNWLKLRCKCIKFYLLPLSVIQLNSSHQSELIFVITLFSNMYEIVSEVIYFLAIELTIISRFRSQQVSI
jgi:hypothetical protein